MVRLHSSTLIAVLRLVVFLALLLSLHYVFSLMREFTSEKEIIRDEVDELSHSQQQSFTESFKLTRSRQENQTTTTDKSSSNKYNLMEETYGKEWPKAPADEYSVDCTVDYANANQLQQDHPCVIHLIQSNYLRPPAPKRVPYQMDHPETIDPSDGQSKAILRILQNKVNGFFIECGGYDGEFLSNTLYMERSLGWTGLLIEADKQAYSRLVRRNRKAYTSPVCLSTKPYPMQVTYNGSVSAGSFVVAQKEMDGDQQSNEMLAILEGSAVNDTEDVYKVQCFPLYSILLAIGRTHVDYFGLDVEGSEYKILKTIPWHKIYVQTLTVEWNHTPEGEPAISRLMEDSNFIKFGMFSMPYSREVVFVQDFLYGFRIFEDEA